MMRRGLLLVAMVIVVGVGAVADCGCGTTAETDCVTSFRSNEIIQFAVTVPMEYYWCYDTTATPLISGWWIEDEAGVLVAEALYSEPLGHYAVFEWNVPASGVCAGMYSIQILLTTGEVAETRVEIVDVCHCYSGCGCYTPCCGCWTCIESPRTWTAACRGECGAPYVVLQSGGTLSCCSFGISFSVTFEVSCP